MTGRGLPSCNPSKQVPIGYVRSPPGKKLHRRCHPENTPLTISGLFLPQGDALDHTVLERLVLQYLTRTVESF